MAVDGSQTPVSTELHGFSRPGAEPTPWPVDYSARDGAFDCQTTWRFAD